MNHLEILFSLIILGTCSDTLVKNLNKMLSLQDRVKILVIVFLLMTTSGAILYTFARSLTSENKSVFNAFDAIQIVLCTIWLGSGILALIGAIKKKKYNLIPIGFVLYATLILNILVCFYLFNEIWNFSESQLLNGDYWKVILGFGTIFSSSGLAVYTISSIYQFYGQLATTGINKQETQKDLIEKGVQHGNERERKE